MQLLRSLLDYVHFESVNFWLFHTLQAYYSIASRQAPRLKLQTCTSTAALQLVDHQARPRQPRLRAGRQRALQHVDRQHPARQGAEELLDAPHVAAVRRRRVSHLATPWGSNDKRHRGSKASSFLDFTRCLRLRAAKNRHLKRENSAK